MTTWLRTAFTAVCVLSFCVAALFTSNTSAQARRRLADVDVDGDGLADVVVAENDWQGRGDRLLVHRGSRGGPTLTQTITSIGGGRPLQVTGLFGIGDVNGDRRTDILVVGPRDQAHVLLGTARGLSDRPAVSLTRPDGETNGVRFAAAGDVNGDGRDDIAALVACVPMVLEVFPPIVIECRDATQHHLYVWHGAPNGPAAAPSFVLDEPASQRDGELLVPVGDLDGDGFADLGLSRAAAFVIYRGSAAGLTRQPAARILDRRRRPMQVQSVASLPDVDGDGVDDLAITVYDDVRSIAFLVHGDRARLVGRTERVTLPRGAVLDGWIAAGDLDGNGRGDFALSTFIDDARRAVLVWRDGRVSARPAILRDPPPQIGNYGIVACPGDIDGDGIGDLVSGSPISGFPIGGDTIGRVYVHAGSATGPSDRPTTTLEGGRGAHGDLGLFIAGPGSR